MFAQVQLRLQTPLECELWFLVRDGRHFVPSFTFEDTARRFLVDATPLLEKESRLMLSTEGA
jgi:hypothetical protein